MKRLKIAVLKESIQVLGVPSSDIKNMFAEMICSSIMLPDSKWHEMVPFILDKIDSWGF